jgi:predicted nuclease of predicted toxin-antitoxin system
MKFLVDAQLPKSLCITLQDLGFDSIHTLDLQEGNRTKDWQISLCSVKEKRIVISKDSDFVESLLVSEKPYKLLYISTGNITNKKLKNILKNNIERLFEVFKDHRFVELNSKTIIVHQ